MPQLPGNIAPGDNWQRAPYPQELLRLLGEVIWPEGWTGSLEHLSRGQGTEGLTLVIELTRTRNSHIKPPGDPREYITVHHLFPVLPASYRYAEWRRWLFARILDVHTHEAAENFTLWCHNCLGSQVIQGEVPEDDYICSQCGGYGYTKPFAPNHADGYDPYHIVEHREEGYR